MRSLSLIAWDVGLTGLMPVRRKFMRLKTAGEAAAVEPSSCLKDGPLFVVGGPELRGEARPLSREHYTLCRCGASKNKPFCDGSHRQTGFKDDEMSTVNS
jgi:CDGSH-type Zn-finger protein